MNQIKDKVREILEEVASMGGFLDEFPSEGDLDTEIKKYSNQIHALYLEWLEGKE